MTESWSSTASTMASCSTRGGKRKANPEIFVPLTLACPTVWLTTCLDPLTPETAIKRILNDRRKHSVENSYSD